MQVANADQEDFDQLHQQLLSEQPRPQVAKKPLSEAENLSQANMFLQIPNASDQKTRKDSKGFQQLMQVRLRQYLDSTEQGKEA
jgi:hypothetical protein